MAQIDGLGQALLEELWNVEIWRGIATMDFSLSELKPGNIFKIEILDKDHENIHNYWVPMGKPEPPTREQIKTMKEFANILKTEVIAADKNGNFNYKQTITHWSVVLIEQVN